MDFKLDEVADSYTLGANLGRLAFYTVMTQSTYDGLPDAQKAAIDAVAGAELSRSAEEAWNATADSALQAARDAGNNTIIELSEEEAQVFNDAVAEVTNAYVARVGGEGRDPCHVRRGRENPYRVNATEGRSAMTDKTKDKHSATPLDDEALDEDDEDEAEVA